MLIQPTKRPEGRNYTDHESSDDCFNAICQIYEKFLKSQNPSDMAIKYDIRHVC